MKTVSTRCQYLDDQVASITDSLIFGHLQRKQYSNTLQSFLSESPHLMKDATTVPNAPNQFIININGFLHDQNLEQIIETFYTYGRFDVSPNMLELGKKLRDVANEISSELAFGCHSYSNNAHKLYGRKVRTRTQQTPVLVNQMTLGYQKQQIGANRRSEYCFEQVAPRSVAATPRYVAATPHFVAATPRNTDGDLQYTQDMEIESAEESSSTENVHHSSRRKAAQPFKQTQRMIQELEKKANDSLRDREAGVDPSAFLVDPFLEVDNFNDILKSVVDGETLYEALETVEREEAMEAEYSRDSLYLPSSGAPLSLDVPLRDSDLQTASSSPVVVGPSTTSQQRLQNPQHFMPAPQTTTAQNGFGTMTRPYLPRSLMEQHIQHPATTMENQGYASSPSPFLAPPPPPPPPPSVPPTVHQQHAKPAVAEGAKKPASAGACTPSSSSQPRQPLRLPPPPPPPSDGTSGGRSSLDTTSMTMASSMVTSSSTPVSSLVLPSAGGATPKTAPFGIKLSSLGRIPKKGQLMAAPSPAASPRPPPSPVVVATELPKSIGFRISKGKLAPMMTGPGGGGGRRDSLDSQDALRAESVADSDCAMTENEDNDHPGKREKGKSEKPAWDDLFDHNVSSAGEESNGGGRSKHNESLENKRRLEMRELEKKKEREKRRKETEKKDDQRRDRSRDDRSRYEKRPVDDRSRRGSSVREDKEEDRARKRREQEQQMRVIDEQKRQIETELRAKEKKKQEEERKMREKEEEKRREKEKEKEKEKEAKKVEDEEARKEREIKAKEERKNELERRMRRQAQQRKSAEKPPFPLGVSPMDKIAAEMDGKELENRPSSLTGSTHSSKSGILLKKAAKTRAETQPPPPEPRRSVRPSRIQMAPVKRPPPTPSAKDDSDEEDSDEDEEEEEKSPKAKKVRLEQSKIDHILNKLY